MTRNALRAGAALAVLALLAVAWVAPGAAQPPPPPEWREPRDAPTATPVPGESPPADEYDLAEGLTLTLIAGELTYPTGLTFGEDGTLYVVEAGYAYGPSLAPPRILRVTDDGSTEQVARLPDGPVTDLVYRDGHLYAIGGRGPAEVWRVDVDTGEVEMILEGFPVWGRHWTSQLAFGPDGKMFFAVGSTSNAGVVDTDDYYTFGYLSIFPEARDVPCVDLTLAGRNYSTRNPFSRAPFDNATTGAFKRFAEQGPEGERVEAMPAPGCNGAVFRANPDGTGLEVVATGFRDVHGLAFAPDGRLLAINQAMLPRGARPVANDCDAVWEVVEGEWYGFPDYPCGLPVTDARFKPENRTAPEPLLVDPPPLAGEPLHRFEPRARSMGIAFSPGGAFGPEGALLVAQHGAYFMHPPAGHRIVRVDLATGEETPLYVNRVPGPNGTAPERPTALRFGPDGDLYVVDFGRLATTQLFHPAAFTGAVWRVTAADGAPAPPGASPSPVNAGTAAPGALALAALVAVLTAYAVRRVPARRGRARP